MLNVIYGLSNLSGFWHADHLISPKVWDGNNTFIVDSHGLKIICMLKAFSAIFGLLEAKLTLNVFRPILQEFTDAE